MSIFRRDARAPGRVTVQEAAARTGHGDAAERAAGTGGAAGTVVAGLTDAVLLDVREPDEWRAGHAPRAVHLPLSELAELAELVGQPGPSGPAGPPEPLDAAGLPGPSRSSATPAGLSAVLPAALRARRLVVICRSGNRSRRAAELLAARGADAVDVIGGMRDWAAAGLPVVDARGGNGTVA
ncbi:rhodanese-like domain-containing protein [Streptomyces collinus]|uniref:rhodanese-like domain-containing protein n=1 Tax=Streptomyces collinus TaxID=42684 RepID=UPI003626414A